MDDAILRPSQLQDDSRVIIKRLCAMEPLLHLKKNPRLKQGLNPGPLDQQARA